MVVLVAKCPGRTIRLPLRDELSEITAGSLPENTLYLPYKGVSRNHFSIRKTSEGWLLRDEKSTNGTRLNGSMTTESILHVGDKIDAGVVEFTIQYFENEKFIQLEDEQPPPEKTSTEEMSDATGLSDENSLVFHKIVFPEGIVPGRSSQIVDIYQKIDSLSNSDVSILLLGETGVGKEGIAKMLHLSGKRRNGPFIAVNCAAIPSELVESELFGIREGVATSVTQRKGKMVLADKGTLFLDELSACPLDFQAKLLRAVEEKLVYPVGEHNPLKVDFRLVGATNIQPSQLILSGKLREDLYHRVASVEIEIPPLRERKEDIKPTVQGLLLQLVKKENKPIAGISRKLMSLLVNYSYPGNVRELVNILNSMVALAHPGEILDVELAPEKLLQGQSLEVQEQPKEEAAPPESIDLHHTLKETSRNLILRALHLQSWNIAKAARYLNVTGYGLRKMMKRLGIPFRKDQ